MPTEVDKLTPASSDAQRQAAISDCIAYHVRNGDNREQAAAKCHSMARKNMGQEETNA